VLLVQERRVCHIKLVLPVSLFPGMAIGNGLCDPEHMLKYGDYLYQIGLIDLNANVIFHEMENLGIKYIQEKKWNEAFDVS